MKKLLPLSLLGALITILLAYAFPDLFQQWEWKTLDMRFQLRGQIETDPNIVLVDADDASAKRFGRWPWGRNVHADMMKFLRAEGAQTIVYDVLFDQPDNSDEDRQLADAVADDLVLPIAVSLTEKPSVAAEPDSVIKNMVPDTPHAGKFLSVEDSIFPFPDLALKAQFTGHIAANRDMDGVVRRVPLLVRYKGKLMPALGFQAVLNYLGVSHIEITASHILLKMATGDINIPVDARGQMLINYAGRWQETFKHASFADVLSAGEGSAGEDLAGKLVLVSNTLSGHDIKPVPFERDYPGSGIHANIVNTILTGQFLKQTHTSTDHTLVLLLCLATSLIFTRRNYILQTGLVFLLATVYIASVIWIFRVGIVLPVVTSMLSIFLTALIISIYRASVEKGSSELLLEEKSRVEDSLQSISKDLARREAELVKIQNLLRDMQAGMEQDREQGKQQSEKIKELQERLHGLAEDKGKLIAQRTELENKVLDLRVHISFEPGENSKAEECDHYGIISRNQAVFEVFRILKQVAGTTSPVLILGESGTGKELFARAAHVMSGRKGAFVPINMGAIAEALVESELFGHEKGAFTGAFKSTKGKFLEADGGTLFLDEIGEMRSDMQVKLLRVLQEKEVQPVGGRAFKVDVRIVAATNKNLESEIHAKTFREDLFYRLNTITIKLPPLRDRKEDINALAPYFIEKYSKEYGKTIEGISDKAMKKLMEYEWPGNIRELENVIQRGVTLATGALIQEKDLGLESKVTGQIIRSDNLDEGDTLLLNALRANRFEINKTASQLNMSRNTVSSRFKGISFDLLVQYQQDREKVAAEISGDGADQKLVLQRVAEYHENLIKTAKAFATEEDAVDDALKRAKNVPLQYHSAIETLTRVCFKGGQ